MTALALARAQKRRKAGTAPIEYSLLLTATMCLLAFGVVMVFSASSTTSLLGQTGDSAFYLKRTLMFGAVGLVLMRLLSLRGARLVRPLTPLIMAVALGLLFVVLLPGVGVSTNGASRWIGAGIIQVQPSELAKLALVLFGANILAKRPRMVTGGVRDLMPYLGVVGFACLLVVVEPDLGTAIVACATAACLLLVAGVRPRTLGALALGLGVVVLLAVLIEPYRMQRLTGFLHPSSDPSGAGFQAIQAKISLGSGGLFGVGLGESLQKAFFLPEAHTDMIAAVIGEELGLVGITMLVGLFGLFGYAGLRTAQRARDRYGKLLAAGLTAMVLTQALINLFAVLGLAPLTGVPLPFVSYGNSSLIVMLAGVGLLLNIARDGRASAAAPASSSRRRSLAVVEGGRSGGTATARSRSIARRGTSADSRRRNSRARRSGSGRSRRAAG